MRTTLAVLLLLASPLHAQHTSPSILYIYRDSLKRGVDSTYGAIEDQAAQICADLRCPNPYLALESLDEPHEAWWINAFVGEADTTRVVNAYAANRALMEALATPATRKAPLIGTPIKGFVVYRPDLSRGPEWAVAGARFMLVTITRSRWPAEGSVWEAADSTLYVFRPMRTRQQAEVLTGAQGAESLRCAPQLEHAGARVGRSRSGFLAKRTGAQGKPLTWRWSLAGRRGAHRQLPNWRLNLSRYAAP